MAVKPYKPFFVRENTVAYYNETLKNNKNINKKIKPKKKVEQFYENPKIKEEFF